MENEQLRQHILKSPLRTVDLIDPTIKEFGLVEYGGLPYKILSWDGNVAHCQELNAEEFVVCSTLASANISLTNQQIVQIWESEHPLALAGIIVEMSLKMDMSPQFAGEALKRIIT